MTFSEFVKILYPFCGNGLKTSEFVILLTTKIMGGQPGRSHTGGGYQNPLITKNERSLQYYFAGTRNIPKNDVCVILGAVDKYKFEQFMLHHCSDGARLQITKELSKRGIIQRDLRIEEICADLFVTILQDIVANQK